MRTRTMQVSHSNQQQSTAYALTQLLLLLLPILLLLSSSFSSALQSLSPLPPFALSQVVVEVTATVEPPG